MTRSALPFVALAFFLLAAPALAGVDLPVSGSSSVKGTIAPEGETEVFSFHATAGTLFSLNLAAKKSPDLLLAPELRDPLGDPVSLGVTAPAAKIGVKKILLGRTGTYRLSIGGTGTGEYRLKMKAKPAKKFNDPALLITAERSVPFDFSAPAGSAVTLKAKAAKKSLAAPKFGQFTSGDLTGLGKLTTKSHTIRIADVGDGEDHSVEVMNLAAEDGAIVVTVTVKAPKATKSKLDLRGVVFGRPGGGETVLGRTVDDTGGVVAVDDDTSDLDGAKIDVPTGAVSGPVVFTVSSAEPSEVPDPEADQTAGPTVTFGPEGLTFTAPVRVTIPYDPGSIPAGEKPENVLRVMRESGGAPQFLDPVEVDTVAHLVTVETTGFSRFTPTSPKGPPNLEGRKYWSLFVEAAIDDYRDPGEDSRRRLFWLGVGDVSFGKAGTANDSSFSGTEYSFEYTHADDAEAYSADPDLLQMNVTGELSTDSESISGSGEWSYASGKQAVTFSYESDDDVTYTMNRDGSILVAAYDEGCSCMMQQILVQKPSKPLTAKDLEGDYWLGVVEYFAWVRPGGGPVAMDLTRVFGTLSLDSEGKCTVTSDSIGTSYHDVPAPDSRGTWKTDGDGGTVSATWEVSGSSAGKLEGTVLLADEFRLFPGPGGNVLIGTDATQEGNGFTIFVLIRKGKGMKSSVLSGDYRAVSWEMTPSDYSVSFVKYQPIRDQFGQLTGFTDEIIEQHWLWAGDFTLCEIDETWSFGSGLTLTGMKEKKVARNGNPIPGGVTVDETLHARSWSESFKLTSDGKLTITGTELDDLVGAVTTDGGFGFCVDDPRSSNTVYGLALFILPPPAK